MNHARTQWLASVVTLALVCAGDSPLVSAAPLTVGNWVISDENTPGRLREFTIGGALVQTFAFPSNPPGDGPPRGIVVDSNGHVQIYNGTFNPVLTTFNPVTGTVLSNTPFAGWSTVNNVTYGGITAFGNDVYATDMATAGLGAPNGVIRFDITTLAPTRFASAPPFGSDYIDITTGLDCFLYAQYPGGAPGGNQIDVIDPKTMAWVRKINLGGGDYRAITVDTNGDIFAVDWANPNVYQFNSTGVLLKQVATPLGGFTNMAMDTNGRLLLANNGGQVIVTDRTLSAFPVLNLGPMGSFVTFVKSPGQGGICSGSSGAAGSAAAEGSFVASLGPTQFGSEGCFGFGARLADARAQGGTQSQAPHLPALLGPFLNSPATSPTLTSVSPVFASSPPAGANLRVFNTSYQQSGQSNGQQGTPGDDSSLVFALLAALTVGATLALTKAIHGFASDAESPNS